MQKAAAIFSKKRDFPHRCYREYERKIRYEKILLAFALLLLCAACGTEKEPVYIEPSNVKSKITESEASGFAFEWEYSKEEPVPCCYITNNTDEDYFTGYGTLEVYANGEWFMANNLLSPAIPDVGFDVPAHSTSQKIRVYTGAYGNAFLPGRYRAVITLYKDSEPLGEAFCFTEEFTV